MYILDNGYHVNLTSNLTWICSFQIHTLSFTGRFTHCLVLGNAKRHIHTFVGDFTLSPFMTGLKSMLLINRIPSNQIFTNVIRNSVATARPLGSTPKNVGWGRGVCGPLSLNINDQNLRPYPIYDLTKSSIPYLLPDPYINTLFRTVCLIMSSLVQTDVKGIVKGFSS